MKTSTSKLLHSLSLLVPLLPKVFSQNPTTNGLKFELNGQPFDYAGTNVYDGTISLIYKTEENAKEFAAGFSTTTYAQDVVNAVKATGYRVLRTWAFNEYDTALGSTPAVYYQSWSGHTPTINYGSNGLGLLDAVVSAAEAADIKLILTLTNNWSDYGGMDVYVNNTVLDNPYHDSFYTNSQIATYYKAYVKAVVSRYSNSSAIFSWELANEPRCNGSGPSPVQSPSSCSPAVLTSWVDTMSAYIKQLDPNHMISVGMEGMFNRPATANNVFEYDGASGQDFDAVIKLDNISFGTIHTYLSGQSSDHPVPWTLQWLSDHQASAAAAGKPVIQEEYGINATATQYNQATIFEQWHSLILNSSAINGDMTWGSLVVDKPCDVNTDVYAICSSNPDYKEIVTDWVASLNGKK
ncbi:hypothetical protein MMC20_007609 [Loxospora ochrophaea]|nr:hypothetical protein [Loxospora ochrophaea]